MDYYSVLKAELTGVAEQMMGETVKVVSARPLSPEEAIEGQRSHGRGGLQRCQRTGVY